MISRSIFSRWLYNSRQVWRRLQRPYRWVASASLVLITGLAVAVISSGGSSVFAATTNLVPNGDFTAGWGGSACSASHYTCVDEGASANTGDIVSTGTGGGGGETEEYDLTTQSAVDTASSVTVNVHAQIASQGGGTNDDLQIDLIVNGTSQGAVTRTPTTSWAWLNGVTFTGTWTQSDVDSMRVQISRVVQGGGNPNDRDDNVELASVYATLDYTSAITFEQSAYRWFNNDDSTDVGTPLAAQDTATDATTEGTPFRLRAGVHVGASSLSTSAQDFKLQYAEESGACDTGFSGETYSDVVPQFSSSTNNPSANTVIDHWLSPSNAYVSDDSESSASVPSSGTATLDLYGFGNSVSGSILGIEVDIERTGSSGGEISDNTIQLIDDTGSLVGDDKASSTWSSTEEVATYGSDSDTWGRQWTDTEVNDSDFGVRISVANSGGSSLIASIDSVTITIYAQSTEPIAFYNNSTPSDGVGATSNINDPVHSSDTNQTQTYVEQNNFTNSQSSISAGDDGLWDFALVDNGAPELTTYCFRIIGASGSELTTYSVIPEITTLEHEMTQLNYGWYDTNSSTPAEVDTRGDQDALSVLEPAEVTDVRLRMLLGVDNKSLLSKALKLQYAPVGSDGVCDTSFNNEAYVDMSAGGSQTASAQSPSTLTANDISFESRTLTSSKDGLINGTDFGFSIPANANITGVSAAVEQRKSDSFVFVTGSADLINPNTAVGYGIGPSSTSFFTYQVGGSSDLWGLSSIDPADINSSSFGVAISYSANGTVDIDVDLLSVIVYYSLPGAVYGHDIAAITGDTELVVGSEDPVNASYSTTPQHYYENQSGQFGIDNPIGPGEAGLYDFSLRIDNMSGGRYCFRVVEQDGTLLDNYSFIPELHVAPQPIQSMRHGAHFSEEGSEGILY